MTKIEKIDNDMLKLQAKIDRFQAKMQEMKNLKTELENDTYISIIRGNKISISDLKALVEMFSNGNPVISKNN